MVVSIVPSQTAIAEALFAAALVCSLLEPHFAARRTFAQAPTPEGLTAVEGIKVGHHTLAGRPTGCTVILAESGAIGGVDVRGGAPGTKETDLLDPVNSVQEVHAISLAGGSAFGLDAATGVMRYLEEKNIGYDTRIARVPIVPAAILFDLSVGGNPRIRPDAECGYAAARAATTGAVAEGSIGAGAGATVGKMAGGGRSMKSGVGSAAILMPSGLVVAALVAVNAVGDIIDPSTGAVIAGVRSEDGKQLADVRRLIRSGALERQQPRAGENSTIGVVATNARLTKPQAAKMAQMAHDGLARAITPVHTPGDGDTIFALATGTREGEVNLTLIGSLAAEATADAIVRAVRQATGAAGIPAARDLGSSR
jgi:L-aminopeptidase/D-esterase-like protein